MGLPISRLVIATNINDILTRFLQSGSYTPAAVHPTISPSMDIQVSSNFERLLFEATGRQAEAVRGFMRSLQQEGCFSLEAAPLEFIRTHFDAARVDEEETRNAMADCYNRTGHLIDPHTAVGWAAAHKRQYTEDVPMIVLATAHPAKFPEAVEEATGRTPHHPHPSPLLPRNRKDTSRCLRT